MTGQEDKEQIKQVLGRINGSFYQLHKKEFKTYCLMISDLCTIAGLKKPTGPGVRSKPILQVLDNLGISYGDTPIEVKSGRRKNKHRIYFILAAQKDRAVKGLMDPKSSTG